MSVSESDLEKSNNETINNWTETNINTLKTWKESLTKSAFIYQIILEKYKTRLNRILLSTLIFSLINMLLSGLSSLSLTINDQLYIKIAFGINIVTFIINTIISALNGTIKIYKYDEIVTNITAYVEKLDNLYTYISSQLILPNQLREDAIEFIKKQNDNYLSLLRISPEIHRSEYDMANKKYMKFLDDDSINFKCSEKYKNNDEVIDIYE